MRGKWLLLSGTVILAAVALGALSLIRREPAPKAAALAVPAAQPPANEISLAGTVQAQHIVPVGVSLAGEIESFEVDLGQEVSEGQLLARIASRGYETMREMASRALDSGQAKVESLQGRILQARLEASRARAAASHARDELDRDQKSYQRQQLLNREGATPRMTFEKSQREFESSQAEFNSLDEIARQAEDRVVTLNHELDTAKAGLDDKRREMEDATANLAAAEVRSPVNGILVGRRGEPGKSIGPQEAQELLQIAVDLSSLYAVADPDPPTLARIRPGQAAGVFVAEMPDGLNGMVKEIKGNQVFVEFVSPNPAIKPGMSAQVRIRTGS